MNLKRIIGLEQAREELTTHRHLDLGSLADQEAFRSEALFGKKLTVGEVVARVLADVRSEGDAAVFRYTRLFDGSEQESLEVAQEEVETAQVDPELMQALELATRRIREFHEETMPEERMDPATGLRIRIAPISTVGAYAPASTVGYPSTVLMTTIPAKVAGVEKVVLATPFRQGQSLDPAVLVAARLAGVDEVFHIGGAQAIAALAYGTETVPRVDMICGPGNVFVTLAKKMLYGPEGNMRVEVTREMFEEAIAPLMERADILVEVALGEASIEPTGIDKVLLVGGSTRIPLVQQRLEKMFGKQPETAVNVDECVALGAALHAGLAMLRENPDAVPHNAPWVI